MLKNKTLLSVESVHYVFEIFRNMVQKHILHLLSIIVQRKCIIVSMKFRVRQYSEYSAVEDFIDMLSEIIYSNKHRRVRNLANSLVSFFSPLTWYCIRISINVFLNDNAYVYPVPCRAFEHLNTEALFFLQYLIRI